MPGCTAYIHDLLDLISGKMLRVRPMDRGKANELLNTLEGMHQRAKTQLDYLVNPQPGSSGSSSAHQKEKWVADDLNPQIITALQAAMHAKNLGNSNIVASSTSSTK